MILKRRVRLGTVYMDELDDRIVISGIDCQEGRDNITASDTATGFGQRITRSYRSMLDVVIRFKILEHGKTTKGMRERANVLEKINAWAAPGGILRVNYKNERRLSVILAQPASEGSLWEFTKEFQLTFRAYTIPYWEDSTATEKGMGGNKATGSRNIVIEGSTTTQCNIELENRSGKTINTVNYITVGDNTMSFTGLGLGGNETLVIDHLRGLLRIRIRNSAGTFRNAMRKRTGANDFKVDPGTIACSFKAERACLCTISWRNRYL